MSKTGGCYCGSLRYESEGEALMKAQCHCRECQYLTGGAPNYFMAMPEAGFRYTKGAPREFTRKDLDNPVTREFCHECGTHILTRAPSLVGAVIVKAGSLDDPGTAYGEPQMAIFTCDQQPFHTVPEGLPCFERTPG